MKKRLLTAVVSGLLAAGGVAVSAQAEELKIAFADNLSSLDPHLNNHAGDRSTAMFFFDMVVNNYNNQILPGLAAEWTNLDENTWQFKLRPDVKFNNGDPLTAEDVAFSIERARHVPGSVAPFTSYVRTVESVEVKDDQTFVITTNTPNPNLPLNLASVHIVSKKAVEGASTEDFNSGKALVGTGPFKLVSFTPGAGFIAEENPNYWGEKPTWSKVDYRYTANASARTAALLSGGVDVIDKVSVSDLPTLEKDPKVSVFAYNGLRLLTLQPSFNPEPNEFITDNAGQPLAENPLLDVRVRQALSLAINREAIADRILQGAVTVANQLMPEGSIGYNADIETIPFDVNKAKELLAEAGYPEGFNLTVHVPTDRYPLAAETVQAVAQFWSRIGVTTQVEVVPWAVYSGTANKNEYAMSVIAWGNGTGEASYGMVSILATNNPEQGTGASNWGRYSSEKHDELLSQITSEFDDAKREELMREAAVVVTDEVGIIPLFHYKNIWAAKKGLVVKPISSDRTIPMMVTKE